MDATPIPRGRRGRRRRSTDAQELAIVAMAAQGVKAKAIAAQLGLKDRAVRHVIERARIAQAAKTDGIINTSALSMTAQQKLAAAIRQRVRELELSFEPRVQAEVTKRNKAAFPRLQEQQNKAQETERAYRQFMEKQKKLGTVTEWNNLMLCLHPDTRRSASDERFDAALAWVMSRKFAITGER